MSLTLGYQLLPSVLQYNLIEIHTLMTGLHALVFIKIMCEKEITIFLAQHANTW